ncbi:MAG: hypothetical protein HYZ44_00690 [Bacteroidetes bacterium]|nr:hypothetical protein [Bacteroidota bacterium]
MRTITLLILLGVLYYWRSAFDLSRSWTPRITVYENKQVRRRTIEFQTRETEEWPELRIIDRISIIPGVYWKKEMDEAELPTLDTLIWRRVNARFGKGK